MGRWRGQGPGAGTHPRGGGGWGGAYAGPRRKVRRGEERGWGTPEDIELPGAFFLWGKKKKKPGFRQVGPAFGRGGPTNNEKPGSSQIPFAAPAKKARKFGRGLGARGPFASRKANNISGLGISMCPFPQPGRGSKRAKFPPAWRKTA